MCTCVSYPLGDDKSIMFNSHDSHGDGKSIKFFGEVNREALCCVLLYVGLLLVCFITAATVASIEPMNIVATAATVASVLAKTEHESIALHARRTIYKGRLFLFLPDSPYAYTRSAT